MTAVVDNKGMCLRAAAMTACVFEDVFPLLLQVQLVLKGHANVLWKQITRFLLECNTDCTGGF